VLFVFRVILSGWEVRKRGKGENVPWSLGLSYLDGQCVGSVGGSLRLGAVWMSEIFD